MRTEQSVRLDVNMSINNQKKNVEASAEELGTFPKPTLEQIDEVLEERIVPDRRTRDTLDTNAVAVERRAHQRRQSD